MEKEPLVKNAADEDQVRESGKRVKRLQERQLEDVAWVLSTQQGRRFFWRYIQNTGTGKTSLDPSRDRTCFNEGERNIGLQLIADAKQVGLEVYQLMERESTQE